MDHLFFDNLYFQFNNVNIYNIVRWHFLDVNASNDASTLSFFFFSSSHLSPTATARLHSEWWVDSLFLLLWLLQVYFGSLFLLLWLFLGIFAQKDTWNSKFAAARFEPSILITFYHSKCFRQYWGLMPGLLPYHVFDAFTVNQLCYHLLIVIRYGLGKVITLSCTRSKFNLFVKKRDRRSNKTSINFKTNDRK